jgi:dienelactone hydrolase
VHFAAKDPIRSQAVIDNLATKVRRSGATIELFDYDAPGHLFSDPAFPAYSRDAAELLTKRVLEFLARLGSD